MTKTAKEILLQEEGERDAGWKLLTVQIVLPPKPLMSNMTTLRLIQHISTLLYIYV